MIRKASKTLATSLAILILGAQVCTAGPIADALEIHNAKITYLEEQVQIANERAALAEELVIALRSDTFNLKARLVQLEGEMAELRKSKDKGWFRWKD